MLGADRNVGSWEISQGMLGACGTFATIAAYAAVSMDLEYCLEKGIYPADAPSPIGLYFVRIQDPANPNGTKWMAIDSKMPCKPGGKSNFVWPGEALAPALLTKAAATARGGCFDEITNSAKLKLKFNWFPCTNLKYGTFTSFASAIASGGLCIFSLAQQYDDAGNKITPSGVVYGHAFAAVDTIEVSEADGSIVQLIRIENPWGGGSDYISDYSESSPFWARHPELAGKLADAKQSGGNYWVSWDCFKKLTGKVEFSIQVPTS